MLSTEEARRIILDSMSTIDTETVPLAMTPGRILRQAVRAERDQPPYDRVTMDGIAINHASIASGRRRFPIEATQHAGDPTLKLRDRDACVEVMTGAVLPQGANTVIPVERISVSHGNASIEDGYEPAEGQFIHRQGSDHRQGTEVLSPGDRIAPVDVAVLASCGLNAVEVARSPVVRVISTGNELVRAGQPIAAHQIRLSNGPAIVAMLGEQAFTSAEADHIADEPDELERRIGEHLGRSDVLILSGGVSMGKADFVPQVLADLGVEVVFHRIAQRPGKPMWFGTGPRGQAVFALPGNPVSSLVCCRQYVLPALLHAGGAKAREPLMAMLGDSVEFAPKLTYFLPVRLQAGVDGHLMARPVPTNTSGDFTALSGTDGYVELAADRDAFPAGDIVPFHGWASA